MPILSIGPLGLQAVLGPSTGDLRTFGLSCFETWLLVQVSEHPLFRLRNVGDDFE